jgi:hypothetical protein
VYICRECGVVFEEPSKYGEIHYELDDKAMEYFSCCPNCGDTFFEEAINCICCGYEFLEDDLIGNLICKDCFEDIIEDRHDLVKAYIMEDPQAFAEFVQAKESEVKE